MRFLALCCVLLAGCAGMQEKIDASRADRCARADWKDVGLRDGVEGVSTMAGRYEHFCGVMFKPGPYKEGVQEGLARRPRPPV
ncbi:MAG TPA: hypothetical protein VF004_12495 [Burkholderiales bacterium]